MTRSTDPRSAIGDLPSFLGAPDRPAHDTDAQRSESEAPEATEEFFDEAEDGYEERGDEDYEDYEDEAHEEVGDDEQADYDAGTPVSARARRRRDPSAVPSAGGVAALAAGALLGLAGIVQLLVPGAAEVGLDGWSPQLPLTIGAVLAALGLTQRRVGAIQQRLDDSERRREASNAALTAALDQLLENTASQATDASGGHPAERALLALQRQDQKINNLTKATKMYGKPLMEITAQGTEVAGCLTKLQAAVEALTAQTGPSQPGVELGEVSARIDGLSGAVASLQAHAQADGREVKAALAQLSSQQEDRLGDDQLQVRLAEATTRIGEGIDQLRDQNVAGIESSVRDVQREVSALAGAIAKLQGAAPAAAPATATAATATASTTPAPTAPANAAAPSTTAGSGEAPSTEGGYATGERKSRGSNVLGAIAKLKQMKG
jgi:hypothetical protein